ncbi:MAG: hypothetical protein JST80_03205 [Bdellovibrionales bacterium]|nr:hypothetical protein [Bdellovibrionales bacterium]
MRLLIIPLSMFCFHVFQCTEAKASALGSGPTIKLTSKSSCVSRADGTSGAVVQALPPPIFTFGAIFPVSFLSVREFIFGHAKEFVIRTGLSPPVFLT